MAALALAPVAVTALTFWRFIPVFAPIFGVLPNLVFATPVFLWIITRFPVRFGTFALGGLMPHALCAGC